MNHSAFFESLKRGETAGAYLFQGEEEYVKARALQALRDKLLPPGLEALNETILTNPGADDVIASAETLPLMADKRLVLIRESAFLATGKGGGEDGERLAAYAQNPPPTACLVFYCRGMPDGRKKLAQALKKAGCVVEFNPLGEAELNKWIRAKLRSLDKEMSPAAAAYLAFWAGRELHRLAQELAKLAAYAGDRREIAREDVQAVVTPSLECTVFQLVDALVDGKAPEAFRLLNVMLENGESRIGILAMMARQYRHLYHLTRMRERNMPEADIQRRLGVPPFAMRRLLRQAKGLDAAALRKRLDLCVDTDYAIKSGKMREDAALERAMFLLCPGDG